METALVLSFLLVIKQFIEYSLHNNLLFWLVWCSGTISSTAIIIVHWLWGLFHAGGVLQLKCPLAHCGASHVSAVCVSVD